MLNASLNHHAEMKVHWCNCWSEGVWRSCVHRSYGAKGQRPALGGWRPRTVECSFTSLTLLLNPFPFFSLGPLSSYLDSTIRWRFKDTTAPPQYPLPYGQIKCVSAGLGPPTGAAHVRCAIWHKPDNHYLIPFFFLGLFIFHILSFTCTELVVRWLVLDHKKDLYKCAVCTQKYYLLVLFPSSSCPTTRPTDACLLLAFKPQSPSCIATSNSSYLHDSWLTLKSCQ